MAFSKQTIFDAITIRSTGHLEIRMAVIVMEDTEEVARKFQRRIITPGDNISSEPAKIQQIANLIWTPGMIAAAQAVKNGQV